MGSDLPGVRAAHEAGAREHPGLPLSLETFARAAEGKAPAAEGKGAPAGDLYLAIACDAGIPGAWERLSEQYRPRLFGVLLRRGAPRSLAEEILEDLPGHLFSPPSGGATSTRIGTYSGRSALFPWLVAVVCHRLVDRLRALPADPSPPPSLVSESGSGTGLTPPERGASPLQAASERERLERFETALSAALGGLTPRERLAVLFRYRDDLPQTEIARLLRVGEPRVSRLLRSATERLRDFLRQRLQETPPTARDHAAWMALEVAVARRLATPGAGSVSPPEGDSR